MKMFGDAACLGGNRAARMSVAEKVCCKESPDGVFGRVKIK